MPKFPLFSLALLLAHGTAKICAASGDEPKPEKPPEPNIVWRQQTVPGQAVTLRVRHPVGKSLIYQGTLDRDQKGTNNYHETDLFYMNSLCASREDGRDLLANLRTFLDRKRSEKIENHKSEDRILMNSSDLIDMGPNFNMVGTLRCYAYDAQNRLAYRTAQLLLLKDGSQLRGTMGRQDDDRFVFITEKDSFEIKRDKVLAMEDVPMPHVCINEAPHYMFPILPERMVSPGDTWRFKVPTIIPLEQGSVAEILPTQFDLVFNARLREVRESAGGKQAVIDYQISGLFDSSLPEFEKRFGESFRASSRVVHRVSGDGFAILDVEHGWLLERHETFNFNFFGSTQSAPEQKVDKNGRVISEKPRKPVESKADITSRFDIKLLMPGTRLKSGAAVPNYD